MAPQVLVTTTTTKAGMDAADALEKELRDVGMTIVSSDARDPAQIGESKVSCYSAETCKDAKALVPVLRSKGYKLDDADTSSRAEDNSSDEAAALYNAKIIRIVLSDPKQSQPLALSTPSRPGPLKKSASGKTTRHASRNPIVVAHQ